MVQYCSGVEARWRWAEYFHLVLNVEDVREAHINVVGDRRMPVLGELNEMVHAFAHS